MKALHFIERVSLSRSERTTPSRTFDQRTRIRVNPEEDIKVYEKKEDYVGGFCLIHNSSCEPLLQKMKTAMS